MPRKLRCRVSIVSCIQKKKKKTFVAKTIASHACTIFMHTFCGEHATVSYDINKYLGKRFCIHKLQGVPKKMPGVIE